MHLSIKNHKGCIWEMGHSCFALSEICFSPDPPKVGETAEETQSCPAAASSVFRMLADKSVGLEFQSGHRPRREWTHPAQGLGREREQSPPRVPSPDPSRNCSGPVTVRSCASGVGSCR